jgi:quercetin dioxygenase-like cupin family protein
MDSSNVNDLVQEQLAAARAAHSGRSAHTIYGGHEHVLRQTVIALAAGRSMAEHESPGEATLLVLAGRVRVIAGEQEWDGEAGDYLVIPPARHSVEALDDAALILTVATTADST